MSIFFITIFSIISLIFILHFVGLPISRNIRKKRPVYKDRLFTLGKRFSVYSTSDKSLMLVKHRLSSWDYEDYYDTKPKSNMEVFTKDITVVIGGFSFCFKYSHKPFIENSEGKMMCYGLYSVDGEKWWGDIWWGHKIYQNPFRRNKFVGCWIYDFDKQELVNREKFKHYDYPLLVEQQNVMYVDKSGDTYPVGIIKWWVEERQWVMPFLKWLHIEKLFKPLTCVDLSFDTNTELGVKRGSWKGGVMGSSINLNREPELFESYMHVTRHNKELTPTLKKIFLERINSFMTTERRY